MKRTLIATALSLCSAGVLANSFQHQTNLDYQWGDILNADLRSYNLSHQFYLNPVQAANNMPLAEAGFLSRSSSLLFGYSYNQFDFGNLGKTSLSGWSLGGEYRDVNHNFYASLLWTELNNSDDRVGQASLGYYLDPSWLLKLDVEHLRPDGDGSVTQYGVSTKKLMTLAHGDFISVEASYMDQANSSLGRFGVAGDYYFGRNLSLGLAYDWTSKGVFDSESDAFTVRGQWYAMPNLALRAGVTFDSLETGDDLYHLGASFRF
ncbi:putative porin [Alishewanella sp. BS5-314]|uniref:putative porin n=1 Tax=Alishewanella sp. BS5-314 TaxID=2755587 RepID=UPI0021BB26EF|nr:putative porin [Alishewanella sp. BS5-314]MCT8126260.1 putative porin [Alishewanella sp. BS5-314]